MNSNYDDEPGAVDRLASALPSGREEGSLGRARLFATHGLDLSARVDTEAGRGGCSLATADIGSPCSQQLA
jgi:hypothetical protein